VNAPLDFAVGIVSSLSFILTVTPVIRSDRQRVLLVTGW
jgi:hypothetical protein